MTEGVLSTSLGDEHIPEGCMGFQYLKGVRRQLLSSDGLRAPGTFLGNQMKSEDGSLLARCLQFSCLAHTFLPIYFWCLGKTLHSSSNNRFTEVFNN